MKIPKLKFAPKMAKNGNEKCPKKIIFCKKTGFDLRAPLLVSTFLLKN